MTSVEKFCQSLKLGKPDAKKLFQTIPLDAQKLFLQHSYNIISHAVPHTDDSYKTAILVFNLFQDNSLRKLSIYSQYNNATVEKYIRKGNEYIKGKKEPEETEGTENTEEKPEPKKQGKQGKVPKKVRVISARQTRKGKYEKEFQR